MIEKRIVAAALLACLASPAFAQSGGSINVTRQGTQYPVATGVTGTGNFIPQTSGGLLDASVIPGGGGGGTGANPTATAGPTAVNGSATTFLRSDGAPAIQKGSSSQFGIVEVDNTSITASAGVISAVAIPVSLTSLSQGLVASPSPITGTGTFALTTPLRSQAGGAIVSTDGGGGAVLNTSGAMTLANATGALGDGFATNVITGTSAATITVSTATLNGNATEPMGVKQGISIISLGGQYYGILGMPEVVASGVLVSSSGRVPSWQAGTTSQLVKGDGSLGTLGTAAAVDTGTSGGTVPLLNANNTTSGNNTHSGVETYTGTVIGSHVDFSATGAISLGAACGKHVRYTGGSAGTLTINSAEVADCAFDVVATSTGLATVAASGGSFIANTACTAQKRTKATGSVIWVKVDSNAGTAPVVIVSGDCG